MFGTPRPHFTSAVLIHFLDSRRRTVSDQFSDIEAALGIVQLRHFRENLGTLGQEHRTAVGKRLTGNIVCSDPPRQVKDLLLVVANQRTIDRKRRHRADRFHVLERLRGYLRDAVAGDDPMSAFTVGDPLGDPQHQPPVEQNAVALGRRNDDFPLDFAKGHEV